MLTSWGTHWIGGWVVTRREEERTLTLSGLEFNQRAFQNNFELINLCHEQKTVIFRLTQFAVCIQAILGNQRKTSAMIRAEH
jgi:hypothetical protein